jgi:hypothetical protein
MSETSPSPGDLPIATRLRELAQRLREAPHLGPAAQAELADLVEELGRSLSPTPVPDAQAHLAESTAHLVQSLHEQKDRGFLAAARKRLEEAAVRAEAEAPLASGLAVRLIDTLANLGI